MAARSIGSTVMTIGCVAIPLKIYTAASAESVSFNYLHKKCSGRVKQLLHCPVDDVDVDRADTIPAFEYAKDQYVTFTKEELDDLSKDRPETLDIVEFVPATAVDLVLVEKSQYLGPDKGAGRAYALFALAMHRQRKVGLGRWRTRSKDTIVIVRPYRDGLALHQIFYSTEVRNFDELELPKVTTHTEELKLAQDLIEQLAKPTLDTTRFRDGWAERIKLAVEAKVAGEEYVVAPETQRAQVIDLLDALRKSIARNDDAPSVPVPKGPKKAAPRSKGGRSRRAAAG